jgi:alpha-ribazole phosphatase/probable phosphoglycerate mutase
MTRLIVCRHADPASPEQAVELAQALRGTRLAAVYSSPLARARETAALLRDGRNGAAILVADLREIDFGDVDGLGFDELPTELQSTLLHKPTRVRFPGGESYEDLQKRVCAALGEIVAAHADEVVAVISHAGAIRAALATWLHMADEAVFRLDQRHASVNVVDWTDGVPLVRLVNGDASSLGSLPAPRRRTMTD